MCNEIKKYKKEHNYDFSNYFDSEKIDNDTEALLNNFLNNPKYQLNPEKRRVPVIELAKSIGFSVFLVEFIHKDIQATIGISKKLIKQYGTKKVIILNNQYTDEEILFALCHILAHYIYDYRNDIYDEYSNTYKIGEGINANEKRANQFVLSLLMPKHSFTEAYLELSKNIHDKNLLISALANTFLVYEGLVLLRLKQLNLK